MKEKSVAIKNHLHDARFATAFCHDLPDCSRRSRVTLALYLVSQDRRVGRRSNQRMARFVRNHLGVYMM
jgi:hypothetical protein